MRRWTGVHIGPALAGMVVLASALAVPALAREDNGSVTVQATNNAAITLSVSDGTADFGTNIDPLGTDSNSSDFNQVEDYQGPSGSYYVWRSNGGSGLSVTVKSNKSWTGEVVASPSTGTSRSLTIESGALRYSTVTPTNYYDAALATPFSTSSSTFEVAGAKGVQTYTHFYSLRLNWDDDPGTFVSSVTYSATH